MTAPLISIITVVYNAAEALQKTIDSLVVQEEKNFEYLVIDGGSNDGTKAVIETNFPRIIDFYISEKDNGLYDAMNKGLHVAKGRFVWFLNAGDTIFDGTITRKLSGLILQGAEIVYGDTMMADAMGNDIGPRRLKAPNVLKPESLLYGMVVCHQAILVKREIAVDYDLNWKIAADYAWALECLLKSKQNSKLNEFMVRFLDGGINKKHIKNGLMERFAIMIRYFGLIRVLQSHFLIAIRFFSYLIIHRRF